jgi:hypothetical protein
MDALLHDFNAGWSLLQGELVGYMIVTVFMGYCMAFAMYTGARIRKSAVGYKHYMLLQKRLKVSWFVTALVACLVWFPQTLFVAGVL